MNPFRFVRRRPFLAFLLTAVAAVGGLFGATEMRAGVPFPRDTATLKDYLDRFVARAKEAKGEIAEHLESYLHPHAEPAHHERHKVVVTEVIRRDVVVTQAYVCQIHSQRHINVCALENGYLGEIAVREGQSVKKGDAMFKIVPTLYQARLEAEQAEAQLAQLEYNNTKQLADKNVVSQNEVALLRAKLSKAQAKAKLAQAELNFTVVKAPFDGIVDRLHEQLGSLINEGDILTTLSDNSVMWVYFNVPEARYLEYMAARERHEKEDTIELVLANGRTFPQPGKIGAIEAKFNNETGNIPFRADFPNPKGLLRHGQTGTVRLSRVAKDAVVIPQRATFEVLDKKYAYAVDEEGVVRQREIAIGNELDDIYVIEKGLAVGDRIVLEGTREVRDGETVEFEFRGPDEVMSHLKNRAE